MLKKHSQLFEGLFTASDILVVSLAWVLSYWVRFRWGFIPVEKGVPPFVDYLKMLIFVWLIWGFTFRRVGLYRPMRGGSRFREIFKVVRANSMSVVLLVAFTYLFREKSVPFSRLVFVIFWGLSTVCLVASRASIRSFLRSMRRRGYNLRHALIVGSGELAAKVAERIQAHPEYGIELVGCLTGEREDDRPAPRQMLRVSRAAGGGSAVAFATMAETVVQTEPWRLLAARAPDVIGVYSDLPLILAQGGIDQVIIAMPLRDHEQMEFVISLVGDSMVDVRIVPDVHQFIRLGSLVEEFDGLPVVSLASTPLTGVNRIFKRLFDMIFGAVFTLLLLPVMLVVALVVKLTSAGPIFFSQERVGLDGKTFKILKFRTMRLDAEKEGARFAVAGDNRVTPVGKCLRRWNLDELPQLFNVVLGQMSLVGPRPERPVFIRQFRRHIPDYMLRHKVQAGMTGWAQVHGWRGNTSIERRIEHDLFYIENWSLLLDIKIIGLTLSNSFRDRNAY